MIWHHLKLSFRELTKDKLNSIINIFGLSIGIASVLLLFIYIQHELSYDHFHKKKERIFRLISLLEDSGKPMVSHNICLRLNKEDFSKEVPELQELTQILTIQNGSIYINQNQFQQEIKCVDSNFNHVFSCNILHASSPDQLFTDSKSAAISKSTALKLFQTENPIGKSISISGQQITISSVLEDFPPTSHLSFDILLPLQFNGYDEYQGLEYFTYVLLQKNCDQIKALEKINRVHAQILERGFGDTEDTGSKTQALLDIHLNNKSLYSMGNSVQKNLIYIHLLLAILILCIATINYTNIIIIQYESKIHQIGIQKAIGANYFHLIKNFFIRTFSLSSIAILIGVILTEIFLPHFAKLMNRNLNVDFLSDYQFLLVLFILLFVISFLSALYPSIMVNKYKPVSIMKRNYSPQKGKYPLSKLLVIFQFTVSITLITAVIISQQQVQYMKNIDLGFQPSQVLSIGNISGKQQQSYQAIKDLLLQHPKVISVSASDHNTGVEGSFGGEIIRLFGSESSASLSINEYRVMPDYFSTLGFKFVHGNPFSKENFEHSHQLILNEKAVELLGIQEDPINQKIRFWEKEYSIVGVVQNFYYNSLRKEIEPIMFAKAFNLKYLLVKIQAQNQKQTIAQIQEILQKVDPFRTNDISYVEDNCREQYLKEEKSLHLNYYTSILSVLLALLGLYSLSLFMAHKRTKEVGIRKVVGASEWQIITLLFSSFAKWILLVFTISVPVSWFIMKNWLAQFAYRIEIGVSSFLIAGTATFLFALLTIFYQTWKTANQNPVESLRYE